MPDIIKLLPEALANQIAAGEVVQRPASVVKELLENAVDAQATDIKLIIKEAGKSWIQVIDNGTGMSETDARLAFERHATSKISKTEDLFNIRTMGFRGEALASIAAVAQVELKTKKENEELGSCIKIEASQFKESEPCSTAKGTSISVKNLFFNIPARRNFLKSNPVEFNHIADEFVRVAMAHPDKNFSFYHNDEEVYLLTGSKLSNRIVALLGNQLKNGIAPCKESVPLLNIYGYIGKPESAKKKRGEQFLFVNERFVRHNYIHYAIKEAYDGMLEEDEHPFYVLFIEIDPSHIDINIHPTKTEIKFDDERTIYAIVNSAVKKAISTFNLTGDLDFSENVNMNIFNNIRSNTSDYRSGEQIQETPRERNNLKNWQSLYEGLEKNMVENEKEHHPKLELRFKSSMHDEKEDLTKFSLQNDMSVMFQIHNSYIVTQIKSGMMLIDQQAAHERILYDKFILMLEKKFGASQQFLFPLTLELNPADFVLVQELQEEIHALGFSFSIFSNNTIVINGIPSDVRSGNEKSLFEGFLEQFKNNKKTLKLPTGKILPGVWQKDLPLKKEQD